MLKRKKQELKDKKNLEKTDNTPEKINASLQQSNLIKQIKNYAADLYYISETDAEILPFVGEQAESVNNEVILRQTKNDPDSPIEEKIFTEFFERLTKIQEWFGDEEKETAEKYLSLRTLLEENLSDLKVFKIGKTQLNIYVVGLSTENKLLGVKTKAIETGN